MLSTCGDTFGDYTTAPFGIAWMHPSGKYLFFTEVTTREVPIVYISDVLSKLEVSGASIPGIPTTVAFSPDGLLVYAIEGSEILVYVFDPHSGLLTARTTINAPGVGSVLPVR
jgi:DNA-binding beta-propeller fold protein YncE